MKVFVSYRRDDTGGRAGRLYDVLATRFGSRNVFHDVSTAQPGIDFVERVDAAIIGSDAVLVVIGPEWLGSGDDGGRRIDRPDDFVHREVRAALTAGVPVVPVLVDGGELPSIEQLPDDIADLTRRQSVTIRDTSWHQDVDNLVRRLEGEEFATTPARPRRRMVVALLIVLIGGTAGVWLLTRGGGDATDDSGGGLTGCPANDSSWTTIELSPTTPTQFPYDEETLEAEIVGARTRDDEGGPMVLIDLSVTNHSEPIEGTLDDDTYLYVGVIDGLLVDGVSQGDPVCMSVTGDPEIEPTERAVATIGFESAIDPTSAAITLEAFTDLDLVVAESS
ncbi:MAG TPA: toll/interleukin-1 receptor domain-containing protein [Ilumatobacteraceae bacterium]|nr:toll/interleukin-1 receptor domain-containing protein [Ilumatobacteraceae bacterium]